MKRRKRRRKDLSVRLPARLIRAVSAGYEAATRRITVTGV